jgi:hypothetical protein
VANAAHELRTPLTAMRTAIEITLSKPARTPDQLEAMAVRVKRSVDRAEATIDALLTLATSELGATAREAIDPATVAEDALDASRAAIAQRDISVETALAPAPARGDRVLIERMIANLVENAGWLDRRPHAPAGRQRRVRGRQRRAEHPCRADPDPFRAVRPGRAAAPSLRRHRARPLDRRRDRRRPRRHDQRTPAARRRTRDVGRDPGELS